MLTATIGVVVVTALAAVANGVIIATGGKELVKQLLADALGGIQLSDADVEMAAQFVGYESMDDFVSSFTTRGYLVAGAGVLLLLFGGLMHKAATSARVLVTISAVLVMVFSVVVLADETTPAMAGLAMAAILGGVLSIVFTWLPQNGRYARALRQA